MLNPILKLFPSYRVIFLRTIAIIYLTLFGISDDAFSQALELRDEQSTVQFSIKNFGLTVNGSFKSLSGKLIINTDTISESHFESTVRAATVDTGIALRDKHLREENYFHVSKYPLIKITSLKIAKVNDQWSAVTAVTIKDITRQVSIPFTIERSQNKYVLKGSFILDRREFGVGGNSLSLANNVQIQLSVTGHPAK